MTTVNETKVKVDGSWISLVPNATTSNKGIVQVGDGLSVTDGVISVSGGSVPIYHISSTNNSGFKVGYATATLNSFNGTGSFTSYTGFVNIGNPYRPISSSPICTSYPPFVIQNPEESGSSFNVSCNCSYNYSSKAYVYWQALRVSDSTILGSGGPMNGGAYTMKVSLPTDWNYTTDTIQFQLKVAVSISYSITGTVTITSTQITSDVFYNPTT